MRILTSLAKKRIKEKLKKKAAEKIADAANKKKAKTAAEKKKADTTKKLVLSPQQVAAAKKAKAKPAKPAINPITGKPSRTKGKPSNPKITFESELRALKSKAMTDANRQREASKLAVKYGRTIRMNGKTFGPKKGPPISRERIPGVKRNNKGEIIDREGT